jgi:hypothetical protein
LHDCRLDARPATRTRLNSVIDGTPTRAFLSPSARRRAATTSFCTRRPFGTLSPSTRCGQQSKPRSHHAVPFLKSACTPSHASSQKLQNRFGRWRRDHRPTGLLARLIPRWLGPPTSRPQTSLSFACPRPITSWLSGQRCCHEPRALIPSPSTLSLRTVRDVRIRLTTHLSALPPLRPAWQRHLTHFLRCDGFFDSNGNFPRHQWWIERGMFCITKDKLKCMLARR